MKSYVLMSCSLSLAARLIASPCAPAIEWQQSYGGVDTDYLPQVVVLRDGGFLLAGWSFSEPSGNKSAPHLGHEDIWLVRIDAYGRKLWDRSYGGQHPDSPHDLMETDTGFLLMAGIGGEGGGGFWFANLDGAGNVQSEPWWNFDFGGPRRFKAMADGGIVFSGVGAEYDSVDYWLSRLDAGGVLSWERIYGGLEMDYLENIQPTRDGGFLLLGVSNSETNWMPFGGGDKTSPLYGKGDVWVVRVDGNGRKLWEQSYGGSDYDSGYSALEMEDGGFVIGAISQSAAGGNKTTTAAGYQHSWYIRVDALGNKLWERSVPAVQPSLVKSTPDGGWISAEIRSGIGGFDYGVRRADRHGNLVWKSVFGGSDDDVLTHAAETLDGGLILVGHSLSGIDGNKTAPNHGYYDIWVVKLGPERTCDRDNDGVEDDRDLCPATPAGTIVNANGCSIRQLVPCGRQWKNHHEYVARVAAVGKRFVKAGLISRREWFKTITRAAQSDCGKKRHFRLR